MLEASLLWYRKFCQDLEQIGFKFNVYDPCVASKMVDGKQHLIRFHVDNVLSSHVNEKVNDQFAEWAQKTYGKLKPMEVVRGKIHTFLGMTLDFTIKGECHVLQEDHIRDIVSS